MTDDKSQMTRMTDEQPESWKRPYDFLPISVTIWWPIWTANCRTRRLNRSIRYWRAARWLGTRWKNKRTVAALLVVLGGGYQISNAQSVLGSDGDDDWPAVMRALDEVGYDGWGISEQPGAGSLEGLKKLSAEMDQIFAS